MLCHVPSIGSCSQFCLMLQLHPVAVPFPPTFASPWRNSFVQIHGGTTLFKAKFGDTPQKRPKNDLNWVAGSSGRVASGGALAPEPLRATRNTPEFRENLSKKTLFFSLFQFSRSRTRSQPDPVPVPAEPKY